MTREPPEPLRTLLILTLSMLGALATAFMCVVAWPWTWTAKDAANGYSLWMAFVLWATVAAPISSISGMGAFLVGMWALHRRRLWTSVSFLCGCTFFALLVLARFSHLGWALIGAHLALCGAAMVIRYSGLRWFELRPSDRASASDLTSAA